jgi:hypothetical protein
MDEVQKLENSNRLMVLENSVLRRIFGPRTDKVTGGLRTFQNEVLHNLCFLPDIIRVTKSRIFGWAGHVERMGR